jgi:hypothetical protein
MAAELGISAASVSRHWRKKGLKPHLVRYFKISRGSKIVEKFEDIVGLFLSPWATHCLQPESINPATISARPNREHAHPFKSRPRDRNV